MLVFLLKSLYWIHAFWVVLGSYRVCSDYGGMLSGTCGKQCSIWGGVAKRRAVGIEAVPSRRAKPEARNRP